MTPTARTLSRLLLSFAAGAGAVLLGQALMGRFLAQAPAGRSFRERGAYRLINPLLDTDPTMPPDTVRAMTSFRGIVEEAARAAEGKGLADEVSVYFRALGDGAWFSVGDTELFSGGSLLKVPILIAALKLAEHDPQFLSRKVRVEVPADANQPAFYKPREEAQNGREYAIEELLRLMIVHSDNRATLALDGYLDPGLVNDVMRDLGVGFHTGDMVGGNVSVLSYAGFFRVLYNASYLGREMSEKALEYLSQADFPQGLQAGIPPGVPAAQKFGEFGIAGGKVQLHDCGIVYHPSRPYILCVMTRGGAQPNQAGVIAEISRLVFGEVDRRSRVPGNG